MALWPTTIKNSIHNKEQALDMLTTPSPQKRTNLLNMSLESDWWREHVQNLEGPSVKMLSAQQQVHPMGRVGQNQHLLYHHVHLLALRSFLLSIPQTLTGSLLSAITIDSFLQNRFYIVA